MRKYGAFLAASLILLVNIIVLAGVARNRSGDPDALVELTERELPLSASPVSRREENTGIALKLDWNRYPFLGKLSGRARTDLPADLFDQAKLEELGFDCRMPPNDPRADLHYQKMLPRKAFVVLEYEGKAWDAWREQARVDLSDAIDRARTGRTADKDIREAKEAYEQEIKARSRLFAIDAGRDPQLLRQRYPDRGRFIVAAAQIRLQLLAPFDDTARKHEPPKLRGFISELLIDDIHVPKALGAELDERLAKDAGHEGSPFPSRFGQQRAPAYTITLAYGRRFEPWVAGVKPLAPEP
jgi:hypothetical protein